VLGVRLPRKERLAVLLVEHDETLVHPFLDDHVVVAEAAGLAQGVEFLEGAVVVRFGELEHRAVRAAEAAVVAAEEHLVSGLVRVLAHGALVEFGRVGLAEARLQECDDAELHRSNRGGLALLEQRIEPFAELRLHLPDRARARRRLVATEALVGVDLGAGRGRGFGEPGESEDRRRDRDHVSESHQVIPRRCRRGRERASAPSTDRCSSGSSSPSRTRR
jgi:hypothetical protein